MADQLVELLTVAALGDLEDRRVWGGHRPQRPGIAGGSPTSLIDMERVLTGNPVAQLAVRVGEVNGERTFAEPEVGPSGRLRRVTSPATAIT